jgi:hypothetical protein
MDVFKLAFETTIVGLLTFVWLGLALDLLFPTFFAQAASMFGDKNQYQSVIGVALLTLAYCFGSAVMPVARQLMNDEHWPLPEFAVRCSVMQKRPLLTDVKGNTSLLDAYMTTKDAKTIGEFKDCGLARFHVFFNRGEADGAKKALTLFAIYENKILGDLSPQNDSFRQLHERIIVLRGAVINGALLLLLCFFRTMARNDTEEFKWRVVDRVWLKTVLGLAIAAILTITAVWNGYEDVQSPDIFDIPILESLFGLATIFGGYWVIKGVPRRSFLNKRTVIVAMFLTFVAYGGWLSSEVDYDEQIILAVAVSQPPAHPVGATPAGP